MSEKTGALWGMLVEFDDVKIAVAAAAKCRDKGFRHWDTHTPFPVHGLSDAMGMRDSRLPWAVLAAGITGAVVAMAMQWFMNAYDYPLIISGKPLFSLPTNIPVVFELTVLLASLTAFKGMLVSNRLPRLHNPLLSNERFRRATQDRFFIVVEARDPLFDREETRAFFESLGGTAVEEVME